MYQVVMPLVRDALLYKVRAVCPKVLPIVASPENSSSHGSFSGMQTTNTLMHFSKDILSLVLVKALEQRWGETPPI